MPTSVRPPALLGDGDVLQAGKSRTAFLLNASHLGGVGGQTASLGAFCGSDVDGGDAFVGSVVYVPCLQGILAVKVQPGNRKNPLRVLWKTTTGSTGPPIIAGNQVWTIDRSNATLYGLKRSNGTPSSQLSLGSTPANHFPTPSVGAGLLLAPTSDQVIAFRP